MKDFTHALRELRKQLKLTQAEMAEAMGLSMSYVHQLEAGKRTASESVKTLVRIIQQKADGGLYDEEESTDSGSSLHTGRCRMVPLVGWAHAGDALDYEENHDRPLIPTECRDPQAFGVKLEGDSMEPRFHEDDVLVVMPGEFAHSGCFAVAKFREGGIIFRQIERQIGAADQTQTGEEFVRLVPVNVRWTVTEHSEKDFEWIYPVWGRWTQIWK